MSLVETIKFEGPQDALVWRNPGREYMMNGDGSINAGSQLIVDEFYEAILFANGNALDLFKPGRHTLVTQNIPLLKEQYEKMTNKSPFPCKVYFINKVHQLELKWGTQGAIAVDDPVYNIFLHVGCCGTMAIRIVDSRKFLLKFVGNKETFTNADLIANMRGIISSRVKDYISKIMILGSVSFFVMNAKIYDIGELVMQQLQPIFESYGLEIQFFNIETIDVPRDDYDQLQNAKQRSAGRVAEGITWDKERMYEVLQTAAGNEGMAGTMMGAGMGLGMGAGIGMPMGQAMGSLSNAVFGGSDPAQGGGMFGAAAQTPQPVNVNNIESGKNVNVGEFLSHQTPAQGYAQPQQPFAQPQQPFAQPQQSAAPQGAAFCPGCGSPVAPGARFCSGCGTKLEIKKVCSACGAEAAPGAAFCSMCGNKL